MAVLVLCVDVSSNTYNQSLESLARINQDDQDPVSLDSILRDNESPAHRHHSSTPNGKHTKPHREEATKVTATVSAPPSVQTARHPFRLPSASPPLASATSPHHSAADTSLHDTSLLNETSLYYTPDVSVDLSTEGGSYVTDTTVRSQSASRVTPKSPGSRTTKSDSFLDDEAKTLR